MGILNEGIELGEENTLKKTILRLGRGRFGEPNSEIVQRIDSIHSIETLTELTDRLIQVETWGDFSDPQPHRNGS